MVKTLARAPLPGAASSQPARQAEAVAPTVTWTALPNGRSADGAELRLSVYVSPRLGTPIEGQSALFPDFTDWPARLTSESAPFAVQLEIFSSSQGVQTVEATVSSEPPSSELWRTLFAPSTIVRPYEFDDFSNRSFVTFPTSQLHAYLKSQYQQVAALSPVSLPDSCLLGLNAFSAAACVLGGSAAAMAPSAALVGLAFGNVYAGLGECLFAVDARSGAMRWQRPSINLAWATPTLLGAADQTVFIQWLEQEGGSFAYDDFDFDALDSATGREPWIVRRLLNVTDPGAITGYVWGERAYIIDSSAEESLVRVVDAGSGVEQWQVGPLPGDVESLMATGGRLFAVRAGADEGGPDRQLAAFDDATGTPLWTAAARPGATIAHATGDRVYLEENPLQSATGAASRTLRALPAAGPETVPAGIFDIQLGTKYAWAADRVVITRGDGIFCLAASNLSEI